MCHFGEDCFRSRRLGIAQGHAHEAWQRLTRTVGVDRADRAWMPRIHRIEQVQRLTSTNLSDDAGDFLQTEQRARLLQA